jgi:hypothetical protein
LQTEKNLLNHLPPQIKRLSPLEDLILLGQWMSGFVFPLSLSKGGSTSSPPTVIIRCFEIAERRDSLNVMTLPLLLDKMRLSVGVYLFAELELG